MDNFMNLKLKELVIIAAVMVFSFPLLYVALLFTTGQARVQFGQKKEVVEKEKKVELIRHTNRKDSIAVANSRSFLALQQEQENLQAERQRLQDQQQHMDMMQRDIETQKTAITGERQKLESLVTKSDSLDKKKIQQLAKVYGAMRPAEAAQIIETLDDPLVVKILGAISDDRQKARILSLLSKEKAGRISNLMEK